MDEQVFQALIEEYYLESVERLQQIQSALLATEEAEAEAREQLLVDTKRELHTLKGNSGMMGFPALQELAHQLEDQVLALRGAGAGGVREILGGVDRFRRLLDQACGREDVSAAGEEETGRAGVQESVRVSFTALDSLVDLLSEMVIFRNRLSEALSQGLGQLDKRERAGAVWREIEAAHETLNQTLGDLQTGIMQLRMVPLGSFFAQLKRIVYDESAAEGKQVRFEASGGDTPLDKALLEVASEAMGHLVRNAVVHGIEVPKVRRAAGKGGEGHLWVTAAAHPEEVIVDIEDDGRGIDREGLLRAARKRGLEVADNAELQVLLSLPGVSTRESADRSAGRGMGMSAVMESVRRRGGQVEVYSVPRRGTRFRLRLPLTAAILRALLVAVDGQLYALPLAAVKETITLAGATRHTVNQAGVVRWRGTTVPLLDLGIAFETAEATRATGYIVFIEAEGKLRGLVVDGIAGIQDVVVKTLDEVAGSPTGLSGCTILGDGRVILILDPTGLTVLSPFLEQAV